MADKQLYLLATFDEETSRKMADLDDLLKQAGFSGAQTQDIPHHLTMASFATAREEEIKRMLRQVCGGSALLFSSVPPYRPVRTEGPVPRTGCQRGAAVPSSKTEPGAARRG